MKTLGFEFSYRPLIHFWFCGICSKLFIAKMDEFLQQVQRNHREKHQNDENYHINVQIVEFNEVQSKARRANVTRIIAQHVFDPKLPCLQCRQRLISETFRRFPD
jgi:hypothetical protein